MILEKKNKKRKIKAFTMVELLAVIVILGIIMSIAIAAINNLIIRSKNENLESHKKTLVMATESYLQHNKNELPSDIGDSRSIKASTLKEKNYLKDNIYNADKKSCMKASFVKVTKKGTKKYDYVAYLYCDGDKVPDDLIEVNPTANILFTDSDDVPYNINKQNVTSAVVNIDINALEADKDSKKEITLEGYSYIISASYDSTDKLVEIYNSGSLNANGKKNIKITRDVTEYIDITRLSYLLVTVEAYNSAGGHLKTDANSKYQDKTPPICGTTEGEPKEDEWNRNWRTKRITIKCSDGEGSGCVRDTVTKTFTKEAEKGIITIRDNAGNKTDCEVRVHLDWTRPTLKIRAYKRLADGSKGTLVGSAVAKEKSNTVNLNKYADTFPTSNTIVSSGDGHWMNKSKYPNGVYLEVETDDNVKLGRGAWSENNKGLTKSSSGITVVKEKYVKEFTKGDKKTSFGLVEEGYRYGTYVLKDKALNEVTIKVTAPIDRTAPTIPTVSLHKKNNATDITNASGLGAYINDTWLNGWVFTQANKSSDAISKFDHYELTTTGKTTNVTNKHQSYRNINAEGKSYIKYRACDKAGNCSNYTGDSTIKLDRTAPSFNNSTITSTVSGKNSPQARLKLYATDNVTATKNLKMCISIGSDNCRKDKAAIKNYESYNPSKLLNLASSYNGEAYSIYITLADETGNVATKKFNYVVSCLRTAKFVNNGADSIGSTQASCYSSSKTTSCTITTPSITRRGYNIVGWGNSASATSKVVDASKAFSISGNPTLYTVTYKTVTYSFNYINGLEYSNKNVSKSCNIYNKNTSCGITTPSIIPFADKVKTDSGSPLNKLFIIKGWNTDSGATWGTLNPNINLSINSNVTYYSIVIANSNYIGKKFIVKGIDSPNVWHRTSPSEKANINSWIKQGKKFNWTGRWAINGAYFNKDKQNGSKSWLYLIGHGDREGEACRKIRKKDGKHVDYKCAEKNYYIKTCQLNFS